MKIKLTDLRNLSSDKNEAVCYPQNLYSYTCPKGPFWWTMPVGQQLLFPTQRNGYMKQLLEIDGANVCRDATDRNA